MSGPNWKIRALAAGDEAQILESFEIVFGGKETSEHWRWLFPGNPFSRPIVYLAITDIGVMNGFISLGRGSVADSDVKITRVEKFDARVDELWARFSAGIPNVVERDSRYLNWRLAEKPADYSLLIAESTGPEKKLLAVAASRVDCRLGLQFGYIVNLFFDPERPAVAEWMVARALKELARSGCSMATALTIGPPSLERALRRCGFRIPEAPTEGNAARNSFLFQGPGEHMGRTELDGNRAVVSQLV